MIVRIVAVLVAALVLAGSAAAACVHPKTSLASLEGQVMCPTCHTTLDQSNSASARRIEHFIQVRINQCKVEPFDPRCLYGGIALRVRSQIETCIGQKQNEATLHFRVAMYDQNFLYQIHCR